LTKRENIQKEPLQAQQAVETQKVIDGKLNELLALVAQSDIDSQQAKSIKQRLNHALDHASSYKEQLGAFQQLNVDENLSRTEMLDEFTVLLANHQVDSKMAKQYLKGERLSRLFLIAISVLLILLGFAMIIMPAPPYFEMFTIFYFNPQDGVTLMDIISLLIILSGIYLLIKSSYKQLSTEK
jgi:archaellum component FlaF (FlaF/FlaG flagellin family)